MTSALGLSLWSQLGDSAVAIELGGFRPPLGITLYADQMAILFAVAASLGTLLLWPDGGEDRVRQSTLALILALGGSTATRYAMRYLSYAFAGAMAVLGGLALVYSLVGSFQFQALKAAAPTMDGTSLWLLFALFGAGFGVKMALLPFHLWQAKAYAETPGPGAAFLGAISSRMGLFAIAIVLVQLIGIARLVEMPLPFSFLSARDLLAWVAVFTIIFPTFTALRQHDNIEEAPLSMILPMMVLSAVVFITGYFPGLVLDWVAAAQASIGLPALAHHLGGVASDKGGLDMIWIVSVLLAGFAVGTLVFFSGNRHRRVHQLDNYAGGHFLTAETRYQYSDNFYPGLMHLIGPWYRKSFRWFERGLVSAVDTVSLAMQGLYRQANPSFY